MQAVRARPLLDEPARSLQARVAQSEGARTARIRLAGGSDRSSTLAPIGSSCATSASFEHGGIAREVGGTGHVGVVRRSASTQAGWIPTQPIERLILMSLSGFRGRIPAAGSTTRAIFTAERFGDTVPHR